MLNLVKPGHVLRFGVDPKTINSPHGVKNLNNPGENALLTQWPGTNSLGSVQCISHPSGPIGKIAADIATRQRGSNPLSRLASYSKPGQMLTEQNRVLGSDACAFVGYVDGQTNYIQSSQTVFSKEFSGCLMAAYTISGQRYVAHVAASNVAAMNCKQAFLDTLRNTQHAVLLGWFRPYTQALDVDGKLASYRMVEKYIGSLIDKLTTFGVITATGQAYAIEAFKPDNIHGNDWIVTRAESKVLSQIFVAP